MEPLTQTLLRLIGDGTTTRDILADQLDRSKSYIDSRLQGAKDWTSGDTTRIIKYGFQSDIEELTSFVVPNNKRVADVSVGQRLLNGTSRDECNNILKYTSIINEIEMDERAGDSNDLAYYAKAIIKQAQRMLAEFKSYYNYRDYQIRKLKDQAGIA